jgi:hypothetical protein
MALFKFSHIRLSLIINSKEKTVACWKTLPEHWPVGTEKNHDRSTVRSAADTMSRVQLLRFTAKSNLKIIDNVTETVFLIGTTFSLQAKSWPLLIKNFP